MIASSGARLRRAELIAGGVGTLRGSLHVNDDDAALGLGFLVFRFFLLSLALFFVLAFPALVARGDLQPGALLSAALLLFAASDLFDDPGLEHGGDNL